MIERLLQLVAQGGVHSYEDLKRGLSISQPMLEMMLEDLDRLGYLRTVSNGCESHCSGCAVGSCSIVGAGRLWSLTDKGARVAGKTGP